MIKGVLNKLLVCMLIFMILFNFGLASITFADNVVANETADESVEELEEKYNNRLDSEFSGVSGILITIVKALVYGIGNVISLLTNTVASSAGKNDTEDLADYITPFDIIFNRFILTDINVFSTDGLDADGFIAKMRGFISMWFGIMTAVAVGILIIIFLVLVSKLALIDDVAERKARVKSAFSDWLISVLLVILMDIIVIGIVNINNLIVSAIKGVSSADISSAVQGIQDAIWESNNILGIGAAIVFILLTIQTMKFLWMYLMRFFKVVLLIIVAPLAPVPYSVSKMNGNKSGTSLNTWLYEFIDSVFTQVIHAVVYVCLVSVAFQGFSGTTEFSGITQLAPVVFAVCSLYFVVPAENLIRKIFGLKPASGARDVIKTAADRTRDVAAIVGNVRTIAGGGVATPGTSIVGGIMNNTTNNSNNSNINQALTNASGRIRERNVPALENGNATPALANNGTSTTDMQYMNGLFETSQSSSQIPLQDQGTAALPVGIGVGAGSTERSINDATEGLQNVVRQHAMNGTTTENNTGESIEEHTLEHTEEHIEEHVVTEEVIPGEAAPGDENIGLAPEIGMSDEQYQNFVREMTTKLNEAIEKVQKELSDELSPEDIQQRLEEIKTEVTEIVEKSSREELDDILKKIEENYGNIDNGVFLEYAQNTAISAVVDRLSGRTNTTKSNTVAPTAEVDVDGKPLMDAVTAKANEAANSSLVVIQRALPAAIEASPEVRNMSESIAVREAIFEGRVETDVDTSTESLARVTFEHAVRHSSTDTDNYDEAYREAERIVKEKGDAAMARVDAFRKNPTRDAYEKLDKHEKMVAQYQTMLDAQSAARTAVQNADQSIVATQMGTYESKNSGDVVDALKGRKQQE